MNKQQFLKELEKALCGLPQEDIQKSLDFYSEMIDDRLEDGLLEQDAVAKTGNPQDIAKQILIDMPITKLVKQKIKPKHSISAGEIVLLTLGSPIWLSLLISAIAVVFSVYVSLWSVVISLWACEVAFWGSILVALAAAVWSFVVAGNIYTALVMIAATLLVIGFGILFFFVCRISTKGMIWISKKIALWIKSCLIRKERT